MAATTHPTSTWEVLGADEPSVEVTDERATRLRRLNLVMAAVHAAFATAMVVLILTPQIFEVGPTARASANPPDSPKPRQSVMAGSMSAGPPASKAR